MKRIVRYILLLLFIVPASLFGQIESSEESKTEVVLDDVFCKDKDFKLRLQYENDNQIIESFFLTEEEIYLCTSTLPFELMIVNAAHDQIMPFEITWLKEVIVDGMGGGLSEIGGDILEINDNDYFEDNVVQLNVSVKFKLSQSDPLDKKLELTIYRNKVEFTQINNTSKYAYDDNEIEGYIGEYFGDLSELNNPWNFLLIGPQDTQGNPIPPEVLRGRIKKEKWIGFVPESIIANDNVLTINPAQVAPNRKANISFDHDPLVDDKIIEVHSCDKEPELLLYAGGLRTYDIRLYRVCESDDDFTVNPPGPADLDPFTVCISPGIDGSVDLFDQPNRYQNDRITGLGVLAWTNRRCDSAMNPNSPPSCTNVNNFAIANKLADMNLLSSKIGVKYRLSNANPIDINLNFDSEEEDGIISSYAEVEALASSMGHVVEVPDPLEIHTALINDLGNNNGNTVNGVTTNVGSNRLFLDSGSANGATWFHEIGHAFGGFFHVNMPQMFLHSDKKNFMYSPANGRINNVRRYQFEPLRK